MTSDVYTLLFTLETHTMVVSLVVTYGPLSLCSLICHAVFKVNKHVCAPHRNTLVISILSFFFGLIDFLSWSIRLSFLFFFQPCSWFKTFNGWAQSSLNRKASWWTNRHIVFPEGNSRHLRVFWWCFEHSEIKQRNKQITTTTNCP